MLCLCYYGPALLRFCFQTNLKRKNSASYLKIQAGKTFCYQGHVLVTLYVQFLCSDWSKFDRWVHAENLCSILKLVLAAEADRVLCQLFNCLFPLDVQNEIQLLSRVFSYLWLVCLLFFLVERCVACQSRKSDFRWHRFRFSPCLMHERVQKSQAILALLGSFQGLHLEC